MNLQNESLFSAFHVFLNMFSDAVCHTVVRVSQHRVHYEHAFRVVTIATIAVRVGSPVRIMFSSLQSELHATQNNARVVL
jgi:hypothetical protein